MRLSSNSSEMTTKKCESSWCESFAKFEAEGPAQGRKREIIVKAPIDHFWEHYQLIGQVVQSLFCLIRQLMGGGQVVLEGGTQVSFQQK